MLYNCEKCPCLNYKCDIYKNCDKCKKRHHSSKKYPMTACELCEKLGCERINPAKHPGV